MNGCKSSGLRGGELLFWLRIFISPLSLGGIISFFVWFNSSGTIGYSIAIVIAAFGFIAVEAGWTVTEVGRQPWIIYGIMRTKDAYSSMPGLHYSFYVITTIYLLLSLLLIWLMRRQIRSIAEFYPSAKIRSDT